MTFMSKGEKRCGLDAIVGVLSRIVQPFRVSINAKGGGYWHVFTGRVCFSLMERTTTTMENRKMISSGGEANSMQRSKLERKRVISG
jgi:hypothetical protein